MMNIRLMDTLNEHLFTTYTNKLIKQNCLKFVWFTFTINSEIVVKLIYVLIIN